MIAPSCLAPTRHADRNERRKELGNAETVVAPFGAIDDCM